MIETDIVIAGRGKDRRRQGSGDRQTKIARAARELKRPGYWACITCGAHNTADWPLCGVCGDRSA